MIGEWGTKIFWRDNSTPRMERFTRRLNTNHLRWNAIGGPSEAGFGLSRVSWRDLWECLDLLRSPVVVYDRWARDAWWGYIHEAKVRDQAIEIGVSLSSLNNKIAVTYSYVAPGSNLVGQRKTTTWITDTDSVSEFGIFEFISSVGGMSVEAAEARAAAILSSRKWPQGAAIPGTGMTARARIRSTGYRNSMSASITCRGWWSSLGLRYASVPLVSALSYIVTSATEQNVGEAAGNTRATQQITVGTQGLRALELSVYGRKAGSPADNLVLALYDLDTNGNPSGSALGSVSIAGSGISGSLGWISGTMSSEVDLESGKQYGLQVSRSGANDGSNYYVINANEGAGYSGGVLKLYDGANWAARSPAADMPFGIKVNNWVESTQQIKDLCGNYGQFITSCDLEVDSGVYLPSYQNGSRTALEAIEEAMESGGPNDLRLLSYVEPDRRVRIFEEPAVSTKPTYVMGRDMIVRDQYGNQASNYWDLPGKWIKLRNVMPGNVDLSRISDPTMQMCEEISWANGKVTPRFRGQPSIDSAMKLRG